MRAAHHKLGPDRIDAGHMLAAHGAEIMSRPASQPAVLAGILDHMTDIAHPPLFAPLPELF